MPKQKKTGELTPEAVQTAITLNPTNEKNREMRIKTSKALHNIGFTVEQIAKILNVGKSTTHRDVQNISVSDWEETGSAIKMIVLAKEEHLAAKVLNELDSKIDKASYGHLIFLYKTLREIRAPKQDNQSGNGATFNVQVIRGNVSYNNANQPVSHDTGTN